MILPSFLVGWHLLYRQRTPVDTSRWMSPQDILRAFGDKGREWAIGFARERAPINIVSSPDGDSGIFNIPKLEIEGVAYRSVGFDCLETSQHGFELGRNHLYERVVGREAWAIDFGPDDHGRRLLEVFYLDENGKIASLSEMMISSGLAVIYDGLRREGHPFRRPVGDNGSRLLPERNSPYARFLQKLEDDARKAGLGIWSDEFSQRNHPFTLPGFFRSKIGTNWQQICQQAGLPLRGDFPTN